MSLARAQQPLPPSPIEPGDLVAGKFRIERVVGEGGMGLVYEATHLLLEQRVALKFLKPDAMAQPETVARFAAEARAAAKLKSEHVARVLDVGEEGSVPYMVMEYLEGKNLEELLAERGALPIGKAVDLVIQAVEGIAEAHACGIVHRDVKPANLFLTEGGTDGWATLKILDFGISKALLQKPMKSGPRTMSILGSPFYMSPEQLRSTRDVDRRTDLWALGVVLYELLTGHPPFSSAEFVPLVNDILGAPHPPLLEGCPDAPPELGLVIDRALAKDPADRYQSAGELALALMPFATSDRSRVIVARAVTMTRTAGIDAELPIPSSAPPESSGIYRVSLGPPGLSSATMESRHATLKIETPLTVTGPTLPETPEAPPRDNHLRSTALFALGALLLVANGVLVTTRGRPLPAPAAAAAAEQLHAFRAQPAPSPPVSVPVAPATTSAAAAASETAPPAKSALTHTVAPRRAPAPSASAAPSASVAPKPLDIRLQR